MEGSEVNAVPDIQAILALFGGLGVAIVVAAACLFCH